MPAWHCTRHQGQLSLAIHLCVGAISVPRGESWKANRRSGVALVTVVYPTSKYDFNDPSHVVMSNEYPACALLELWHSYGLNLPPSSNTVHVSCYEQTAESVRCEFCHMTTMMSRTVARQQYRPIISATTGHARNYRSTARRYICVWSY